MTGATFAELLADDVWQMPLGERVAIEGILSALRPRLALEVGTAEGASLRWIARHAAEAHSIDLVAPTLAELGPNVHLHSGDSRELLPRLLEGFAAQQRNVDFVLVDGDHSPEGVRRDVEALLASPAIGHTVILAHDTANERVRSGLDAVPYDAWPKVAHVDLDLVPGHLWAERFAGELWDGLGIVVVAADRSAYGTGSAIQSERHHHGRLLAIARDVLGGVWPPGGLPPGAGGAPLDGPQAQPLYERIAELEQEVARQRLAIEGPRSAGSWRVKAPRRIRGLVRRR